MPQHLLSFCPQGQKITVQAAEKDKNVFPSRKGEGMYFPTEEEKKALIKGLFPRSRHLDVAEDFRGWNWNRPPLEPIYDIKLALWEVASYYCKTGRDLYLRRVQGIKLPASRPMIYGSVLHRALADLITRAKTLVYVHGIEGCQEALDILRKPDFSVADMAEAGELNSDELAGLEMQVKTLWRYQANALIAQIDEILAKQPYIGVDSLVNLAVPITVEQKLDGSFLGLSTHLSADAYRFYETMILDLKFGERRDFHRLSTTGYAIVMEALYEYPINCGCIAYARFKNGRLMLEKDYHLIDDELRQWFIDARDEKMRMIFEEIDPGKPDKCPPSCQYLSFCSI
jgi:CRISPR-associated protein Csa1